MNNFPKIYLYRRIVQSKLFMDAHYGKAINLDMLAEEAFFSKYHFIRLFKSIYNKTPHQYLMSVRIEKAKLLLKENNSVNEVCFAVGFDSVTSFASLFKRIVGSTPSSYQQEQLKRKADIAKLPLKYIPNCFAEKSGWTENSNFQEVSL